MFGNSTTSVYKPQSALRSSGTAAARAWDSGDVGGSCGVEAAPLTPEGRGTPRLPSDAARMRGDYFQHLLDTRQEEKAAMLKKLATPERSGTASSR